MISRTLSVALLRLALAEAQEDVTRRERSRVSDDHLAVRGAVLRSTKKHSVSSAR